MIPHNIALLREQVSEIGRQLIQSAHGIESWFKKWNIHVENKISCWVLSTKPGAEINHWNRLTNGMVIDRNGSCWSFPFMHFYNLGEKNAPNVNMHVSDVIEKIDGHAVCACFPARDASHPMWHNDVCIDCSPFDNGRKESVVLNFIKSINKVRFTVFDLDYTYMFQLINEDAPTQYTKEKYGLYLVGGRRLTDFNEYDEKELDQIANRFQVMRPGRWTTHSGWEGIQPILEKNDLPGFLLRERNDGLRIKLERKRCLDRKESEERSKKLNKKTKYKRLLPEYQEGKAAEVISKYPESKDKFDKIETSLTDRIKFVIQRVEHWKMSTPHMTRRDIVEALRTSDEPSWARNFIIKLIYEEEPLEPLIRNDLLRITHGHLRRILGLRD